MSRRLAVCFLGAMILPFSSMAQEYRATMPDISARSAVASFGARAPKVSATALTTEFEATMPPVAAQRRSTGYHATMAPVAAYHIVATFGAQMPQVSADAVKSTFGATMASVSASHLLARYGGTMGPVWAQRTNEAMANPSPPAKHPEKPALSGATGAHQNLDLSRCKPLEDYAMALQARADQGHDTSAEEDRLVMVIMGASRHMLQGRMDLWCNHIANRLR